MIANLLSCSLCFWTLHFKIFKNFDKSLSIFYAIKVDIEKNKNSFSNFLYELIYIWICHPIDVRITTESWRKHTFIQIPFVHFSIRHKKVPQSPVRFYFLRKTLYGILKTRTTDWIKIPLFTSPSIYILSVLLNSFCCKSCSFNDNTGFSFRIFLNNYPLFPSSAFSFKLVISFEIKEGDVKICTDDVV